MKTAVITPSPEDVAVVAAYMAEGEQRAFFHRSIDRGQRLGQAFMNSLREDESRALTGTSKDPFYRDDLASVLAALEWLTYPGSRW